jgi:hypothetical protein
MGEVIVFRPSTKHVRDRVENKDASQARVYVFTGVRYAREDGGCAPSSGDPGLVAPPGGGAGRGKRRKRG